MKAVLFDLGNTLAEYHAPSETRGPVLSGVRAVEDYLRGRGLISDSAAEVLERFHLENHESRNYRVRPLQQRLSRIFRITDSSILNGLCPIFLEPITSTATIYEDTVPTLHKLRKMGLKTAVVSNTPWGSPSGLWGKEIERLGLTPYFDALCFCTEVGWRKPAKPVFHLALHRLGVEPAECLFVGDRPKWDVDGPKAVGMTAVLIDRYCDYPDYQSIKNLRELPPLVEPPG